MFISMQFLFVLVNKLKETVCSHKNHEIKEMSLIIQWITINNKQFSLVGSTHYVHLLEFNFLSFFIFI